jgi:serine/threonine-protein kinase
MSQQHLSPGRSPGSVATTVTGTEEGRAFYQSRISLVSFSMFLLAGGTWLVFALAFVVLPHDSLGKAYHPLKEGGPFHLAEGLLACSAWLVTRRGRLSGRVLHALDVVGSLVMLLVFTGGGIRIADPTVATYVLLMGYTTVMLARAIVVPSTARRTLLIGLTAGVPLVAVAVYRGGPGDGGVANGLSAACWLSVGVALGTLASRTIFGLRREVQQARVLGQYTLESKIGEGGMGEVWRASHALLRRPTAIKLLLPDRNAESAIRRFEKEAQITSRLTHPSTVSLYDYGRTREGVLYYAMELLEGSDLERLVAKHGPQSPARVVHILAQVCGALAEAHDLGLVHRDVKPGNVLLLPKRGEPELAKVVDFGLVKELRTEASSVALTAANAITGTPLYMAPEAIREPERVGPASDLYALGAVGWFLLVGRPPFEGHSIVEVCGQHLHTPPARPSTALGRPIARDVEDVVLSCLEKEPSKRPAGARALRHALRTCSLAGQWTEEDATRWWEEHANGAPTVQAPPVSGEGPRTISLDIVARAIG